MELQTEASQDSSIKKSPFDDLTKEELINKCKGLLVIAQKAKQAKSELQTELDRYKTSLNKLEEDKKVNLDNFKTLQELVDSLTEQKLNLITEVDAAQNKIKLLNDKCTYLDDQINKNKADLIVRDNKITDIKEKLSGLDCEVISLKRQNNRLTEENEQLINQLSEIEERASEVNNIGLIQREQLQILEESVHRDEGYKKQIQELTEKINKLEGKLQIENYDQIVEYEHKIKEVTQLYESEKNKKEKANIKLRSYKDKILKCAACINQLKNSRFILTKTVKEYSENIPKWQKDIIKASQVLEEQITKLNNENASLRDKVSKLENEVNLAHTMQISINNDLYESSLEELNTTNNTLKQNICHMIEQLNATVNDKIKLNEDFMELKLKYDKLNDSELPTLINENQSLKEQVNKEIKKANEFFEKNKELLVSIEEIQSKNKTLNDMLQSQTQEAVENMSLQIRALESEKAILVKEKLNAKDLALELDNQNNSICEQNSKLISEIETLKYQLNNVVQEKLTFEKNMKDEKESDINLLKLDIIKLEEQYNLLKKEHDNILVLNGLLREEVDTLKLSLEQPKDETDNLSDLNVSLQADIVKLETKLSAYKQENASLLTEVKESRNKLKEFDNLATEYEDAKSKLLSYKSENTELLNEMKEINQVLKERGESISKLQKAITEMERLVETLEKDRDDANNGKSDLLAKIDALDYELQNIKQKSNEDSDLTSKMILERDQLIQSLKEKECIIESLKEDLERIKQNQQQSSVELPNEDMSTSTISKAEEHARMKDLDETFEEKYSKLRLFALKLKKRHNEVLSQLEDTLKEKAKLEMVINENELSIKKANSVPTVDMSAGSELEQQLTKLSAAAEEAELLKSNLDKVKAELEVKNQKLDSEIEAHKITRDNLEKAKRDVKKKNVLSLEMEDYERSMKELTAKMEENKKKMMQMESTIDTQEGTMTAMKTQIKLLEEQIKTEENQNRLVKEELLHAIEEGKEKDNVILVKNGIITQLEQNLEDEKRKNEESDLEMTSVLAEKEKMIISLGEEKVELNNKVKKLEFKCAELNENLRIMNIELADLKTEYASYKVRAQAVLRQNQTVDHSQEEQLKEEAAALRAQIESLTAKLTTVEDQCAEQSAEVESMRRRVKEAGNEAARANQRTARLQTDLARIAQQMESERTQHKLQVSTLTQCYKTQVSELESKLQKETEKLKQQLTTAQEHETFKSNTRVVDTMNQNQYMIPVLPKDENSDSEMDINVSMIPREEGEGSESAPSPPPSKSYTSGGGSGRSPVPLERLLEEGVPDDDTLDTSALALTPDQEIADLKRRLTAQQQRVKHVTVLLSESERECARMAQLSELLKVELRRVRGTTQNVHNTEYMKNVTLKFLTLPPGDERSRLVPVLQKILSLTQEESQKIQAIAKGLDPNPSKAQLITG
ncbi:hypothetical protein K1T71_003362 [Dendrolimus kikuchii]|uniref:Uncharacterized protein n=1 Tax=Dendrolimus kikuchii TaxID=765133 RepID=A0ACC1DBM9_9NEOP|nr:hypothetical protein K1T71_003362 [Dendrolimus kikuchii]